MINKIRQAYDEYRSVFDIIVWAVNNNHVAICALENARLDKTKKRILRNLLKKQLHRYN